MYAQAAKEALARANQNLDLSTVDPTRLYIEAENADWAHYNRTISELVMRYPDDVEAVALWAMQLVVRSGPQTAERAQAQKTLRDLLVANPRHAGLLHYWIHSWEDTPQPQLAVAAAKLLGELAPDSPHEVHMSGHVWFLLGDFPQAVQAFRHARTVDLAYLNALPPVPHTNHWEYVHNLAFLSATLTRLGKPTDALQYTEVSEVLVSVHCTLIFFQCWLVRQLFVQSLSVVLMCSPAF
jgi:tetratricopeptide (TPR) repeat protein